MGNYDINILNVKNNVEFSNYQKKKKIDLLTALSV